LLAVDINRNLLVSVPTQLTTLSAIEVAGVFVIKFLRYGALQRVTGYQPCGVRMIDT
jgi:hypothetical protein